jgi:hypothetical protein
VVKNEWSYTIIHAIRHHGVHGDIVTFAFPFELLKQQFQLQHNYELRENDSNPEDSSEIIN